MPLEKGAQLATHHVTSMSAPQHAMRTYGIIRCTFPQLWVSVTVPRSRRVAHRGSALHASSGRKSTEIKRDERHGTPCQSAAHVLPLQPVPSVHGFNTIFHSICSRAVWIGIADGHNVQRRIRRSRGDRCASDSRKGQYIAKFVNKLRFISHCSSVVDER